MSFKRPCKNCGKEYALHGWRKLECKFPRKEQTKFFYEESDPQPPQTKDAA